MHAAPAADRNGGGVFSSSLQPSLLPGFAFFALWVSPICVADQDDVDAGGAEFVEPIVTEETMPNEVGEWNLRFACVYESGPEGAGGDCPQAQVFFGIAPRWGAEVEASFPRTLGDDEEEPTAEISATLKYLLRAPGTRGPAVVLAMETAIAVDRGEESEEGRIELQPTLAWLQPLGRATLQGNVGLAITPGDSGSESQTSAVYNASWAFPLPAPGWHGFAEVAGIAGDEETELVVSPGLKYSFSSGHFLAVGVPVGLTSHSPDIGLIVQMQLSLTTNNEASGLEELARSTVRRRN